MVLGGCFLGMVDYCLNLIVHSIRWSRFGGCFPPEVRDFDVSAHWSEFSLDYSIRGPVLHEGLAGLHILRYVVTA